MARGINKVILIGNLGNDPETRHTAGGSAVTNLSLATSRSWRDRQSGDMQEKTEWHRVVMFSKLAEIAGEYLRKGSKVYIEGRLQTRKWQDRDGNDRWTTEVVANEMQMLDGRGGSDSLEDGGRSDYSSNNDNNAPGPAPAGGAISKTIFPSDRPCGGPVPPQAFASTVQ